jgi:hypothetical protein
MMREAAHSPVPEKKCSVLVEVNCLRVILDVPEIHGHFQLMKCA